MAASSAEPDLDCSLDLPANLFVGAFPAALATVAQATSAAGFAASQLVDVAEAQGRVAQAYPVGHRRCLFVRLVLLLPHPGSPLDVAPVLQFQRQLQVRSLL